MEILTVIAVIYIVIKFIKESCQPKLPPEYHGNMKLEMEDAKKVERGEMSKKQFNKNINSGKYYAPIKKYDEKEYWEDFKKRHPWGKWND